jgi:hypothetical protein
MSVLVLNLGQPRNRDHGRSTGTSHATRRRVVERARRDAADRTGLERFRLTPGLNEPARPA